MSKISKLIQEAIENIREDRTNASELLKDVAKYIGTNQERHREVGVTAAKYLETLQRSNEQLVKLISLNKKATEEEFESLNDNDKENLFDELENVSKH